MKDLSYFALRAHLYSHEQNQTASVKLEEIEKIWYCTKKNVKRKLKQYQEQGKLIYTPGKGRGNSSYLTFKQHFQEEVKEFAQYSITHQNMDDIVQLLQLPIPKSWIADVSAEVRDLFGLQGAEENKDILRTIISRDMTTIDPVYSSITFENHIIRQLGDTLVVYNSAKDCIEPHLAHHWRVNVDFTEWKFYIRKGVRFHHQSLLTAEDIKFTFERFTPDTPYYWLVNEISEIKIISPYVIVFQLKKANPFFLRYLSAPNLVILPKDVPFDEYRWIGTGPFQLKERNAKQIVLEAFDHYFLERPFLDRVEFWKIPMETAKTVSYTVSSDSTQEPSVQKREIEVGFRFLAFNFHRKTSVQDDNFRLALFHLLDVNQMAADLNREKVMEATSFFPWKSEKRERNQEIIRPLLIASGYLGEALSLYCLDFPSAIEEARWFQSAAKKFGINLDIATFNFDDFYSYSFDDEADLLFMGEVATQDYQLSFLGAFYNQMLIFRRFFGKDHLEEIDGWLEEFKQLPTREERDVIIEKVEQYIKDQNLILFEHHPIKNRIFHPMIQDIVFESYGQVDFRKLWFE